MEKKEDWMIRGEKEEILDLFLEKSGRSNWVMKFVLQAIKDRKSKKITVENINSVDINSV